MLKPSPPLFRHATAKDSVRCAMRLRARCGAGRARSGEEEASAETETAFLALTFTRARSRSQPRALSLQYISALASPSAHRPPPPAAPLARSSRVLLAPRERRASFISLLFSSSIVLSFVSSFFSCRLTDAEGVAGGAAPGIRNQMSRVTGIPSRVPSRVPTR